jgi:molecular chaperone GrpE
MPVPKQKSHEESEHPELKDNERVDEAADKTPEDIMEIESVSAGTEAASGEIQKLQARVQDLEARLEKEKKEQLYIRAEFDTYRRRSIKEKSDALKFGAEKTLVALLGVLDNFERALGFEVTTENLESYKAGVQLIAEEIKNLLKREGVEEVQPKNNVFDPNAFEAISSEESADVEPGHITRIFRKAYKLHDRVIRPGQAVVARAPAKTQTDGQEE